MTLEKACKILMIREPFYGLFLSGLNKIMSDSVPTISIGVDGINPAFYINSNFWNKCTDEEQLGILKHELIHLCFFHPTMRKSFKDYNIFNIAADIEVNQHIDTLPQSYTTLELLNNIGFKPGKNLGAKVYYEELIKFMEEEDTNAFNLRAQTCDNHDEWTKYDELSDSEKKLIEEQTDFILKNVASHIMKSRGTIPAELKTKVNALFEIKPQVFNWKAYFRRAVGNSMRFFTKKTLRKPSKRFDDSAGIKVKQKHKVLVAIDTSGSLCEKELSEFFSEINHMYKSGTAITIIESDARIGKIYDYTGVPDLKISGGGGTDFSPVVEYYNDHKKEYTSLIYFTDGCAPLNNFKVMNPIIWLISSTGAQEKNYPGLKINIPKQ